MATWLQSDLAATSRDWIIAWFHDPPYTRGTYDSDDKSVNGGRLTDMRQNLLPILEARGVDLVLSAYSKSYERSCLLRGHYGTSRTLTPAMKIDPGDGRQSGSGAYSKAAAGPQAGQGTVYAVVGTSGATGGGHLDHPVMVTSLSVTGSLVIDIDGPRLDAHFIDGTGKVRDDFSILKSSAPPPKSTDAPPPSASAPPLAVSAAPSPFRGSVLIRYTLPGPGRARLSIYSVDGRRIARLLDQEQPAGTQSVEWNGRDAEGRRVGAGVYFVGFQWSGNTRTTKLVKLE
jgi:hypothetical protein